MEAIKRLLDIIDEPIKNWIDLGVLGIVIATFIELLPAVSGLVSLVWLGMRMYETWLNIKMRKQELKDGNERID